MKNLTFAALACFVIVTMATVGAWADAAQITLSKSPISSILFADTGSGYTANFSNNCGHANCISGNALLDFGTSTITGKYSMWIVGGPLNLTGGLGVYTVNQGSTGVYLQVWLGPNGDGSQGKFSADVLLTDMSGGGQASPHGVSTVTFDGSFVPTLSTINFASSYPVGVSGPMSLTVDLANNGGFAALRTGSTMSGKLSSGELDSPVPEPASLALLGTGVLGLAGLIRHKTR